MAINDEMRGDPEACNSRYNSRMQQKQGMQSLLDYGMNLVKQQLTTLAEVERVCVIEEPQDV